jgi:hypothetical protein
MSIMSHIDQQKGITLVLWNELVTAEEWLAHVSRLCSDPDWPPLRRLQLIDLQTAFLDPSIDERILERGANLYGQHSNKLENLKVAVVAPEAYRKGIIFESLMSRYEATVITFNSLDTACVWLGLEPGVIIADLNRLQVDSQDGKKQRS